MAPAQLNKCPENGDGLSGRLSLKPLSSPRLHSSVSPHSFEGRREPLIFCNTVDLRSIISACSYVEQFHEHLCDPGFLRVCLHLRPSS